MRCLSAAIVLALMPYLVLAQDAGPAGPVVAGKPVEVTVYRGQARVVREVEVTGKAGPVELVVTDLPQRVIGDSLFAEGGGAVEVRAVRFRSRPVGEEPQEAVRELDRQIQAAQDELGLLQKRAELLQKQERYLDKLEQFVAPTASAELTEGVLDAEQLERTTRFAFEQRERVMASTHEIGMKAREVATAINLLQRKRAKLASGGARSVMEAVLFLDKRDDRPQRLRLTYLVSGCGWSPAYSLRGNAAADKVVVEYNALIQQMSGEDWSNVAITLSTASPGLSAASPGLAPLEVALLADRPNQPMPATIDFDALQKQKKGYLQTQLAATGNDDNFRATWGMNTAANKFQFYELNASDDMLERISSGGEAAMENGPSISYTLPGKVSLASRSDQQMLRIVRAELDASLYYVAMPVLSSYVYREAELANTTGQDLLGGPVSVYLDGRFVGRTEITTVARGQQFVVGFGADPQLQCSRELIKRDDEVQGGNKVQKFSYRLAVGNYKQAAVPVRIYDRVPTASRGEDLRLTLGEMSEKLSTEAVYVRRERPRGILRWDVTVPAGAAGAKEHVLAFDYMLEFDRKFALGEPTGEAAEASQRDFMQLQQERFYNK